jgi:hypothetical protein
LTRTNQPTDLTWLSDGKLGITQPMPGKLEIVDGEGNPCGSIVPEAVSADAAQFGYLTESKWRGGTFVACGGRTDFRNGQMETTNFLSVFDILTGEELAQISEKKSSDDGHGEMKEVDHYWLNEGRWCLGPGGKIYTAPNRDTYTVNVYSADGNLEKIIERDYEPRHRTNDEINSLKKRMRRPANEWGGGREPRISGDDPCISELRVSAGGELWVRHSRSRHNEKPKTFETWDVFGEDGKFNREVSLEITGNPDLDKLLFLNDNHLLLIKGFYEASDAMWGQGDSEEQDTAGEIVLYEIALD